MEAQAASTEIAVLGWSVVLLILQVVAQASAAADLGARYLLGPRDEARASRYLVAGRLRRALRNLLETYPAFVALALALAVTRQDRRDRGSAERGSGWRRGSSYVGFHAAGIPVLRTLALFVSIVGLRHDADQADGLTASGILR